MTAPDPQKMEHKLDELQDDIDAVRHQAEEHGTLPQSTPQQTFVDPDGDGRVNDEDEHPGEAFAT